MPETKQCPWPDPKYPGKQCCTAKALGLDWFPEKALFTEYRQFTLGDGHDLADFDTYLDPKIRGLTWPVVNGKPTTYRFNAEYDPYVKNGDFEFYGKLMKAIPQGNLDGITDKTPKPLPGRAKIFFRPFAEPVEKPDSNYDLMLCTGRILEHWHTGSMTRRVPELHRAAPSAVLYMHPADAQKRGLKRNDVAQITSRRGSIKALVETQGRMKMRAARSGWPSSTNRFRSTSFALTQPTRFRPNPTSRSPRFESRRPNRASSTHALISLKPSCSRQDGFGRQLRTTRLLRKPSLTR